jgi:hypothetical protein
MKEVNGYEEYVVDTTGSIFIHRDDGTFLKLKIRDNAYGYGIINIRNQTKKIHRLIAEAFLGNANGLQVNHIDGNKMNNTIDNLEYVTRSQNMKHSWDNGLTKRFKNILHIPTGIVYASTKKAYLAGNFKISERHFRNLLQYNKLQDYKVID